ncbi:hypothetical protein GW17_00041467 [Ensete ventricosum]|nr:hypothetical protein GW17_00041467 [Ensete ventricosum]
MRHRLCIVNYDIALCTCNAFAALSGAQAALSHRGGYRLTQRQWVAFLCRWLVAAWSTMGSANRRAEVEVGEGGGKGEGELDYHVVGTMVGSVGEDKVEGSRDENTQDEDVP